MTNRTIFLVAFAAVFLLVLPSEAVAAESSIAAFDKPLDTLRKVFTGPIAYTAALLGVVVAGAMLVFGGEISDFAKRLIMLVLVISVITLASQILTQLFGASGAVINI